MSKLLHARVSALSAGVLLGVSLTATPQTVPTLGVTGTMALEGTIQSEYEGVNLITVNAIDGARHVFHLTKDLLVHGGKGNGPDALRGLRAGTTVVIHYTTAGEVESAQEIDRIGEGGLKVTEGTVARVDSGRRQIVIRFDDGKTETLRLTERAAGYAVPAENARITVYYTDDTGEKIAHYFKRVR
jgi:hypothetical protein